jgi:predicted Zn-dependent protease
MAEAMTKAMRIYHNNRTEGWLLRAECINETKGAKEAAEVLIEDEDSFKEQADVLFAIGRYLALASNLNKAKDYIRRAIKLNGKYRSEFLEDDMFNSEWERL